MEEKQSSVETCSDGDNHENEQKKRKGGSPSSSGLSHKPVEDVFCNTSISLDLSRKDLQCLPEDISNLSDLNHLHLEGNELSVIPEDFFQQLPNLVWLDLRYNRIKELPPGIGYHKQLKTLLLESNPVRRLPIELGNLTSLTALNLRNCPLEFPPPDVVQKGLPVILCFLQKYSKQNLDDSDLVTPEMPPIEKLNLTDLSKSSMDLSDEWPNEEEMIRFQKLRDELIQNERKEYLADQRFPNVSMTSVFSGESKAAPSFSCKWSVASSRGKKNLFPAASSYDMLIQNKRTVESRLTALKEMKEKQALLEQRRKDKDVLQRWRRKAKVMREKKEELYTFSSEKGHEVSQNAPYATSNDSNYHRKLEGWDVQNKHKESMDRTLSLSAMKAFENARAAKYREVENRIRQHTQIMKERRKKSAGIPREDMLRAQRDYETAEALETELADLKKDLHPEYRFTAFTGELPASADNSLSATKPQNIFSNMTF